MEQLYYTRRTLPELLTLEAPTRICLELDELPSAGYVWNFEANPTSSVRNYTEKRLPQPSCPDRAPGAPVTFQALFTAAESGIITVKLHRPWESEVLERISFAIAMATASQGER